MSVPSQTPYNVYTANGLTTVFAYQFMIMTAGDLEVSVNGTPVSSGFTVQGAGQTGGGQVVFITPPAGGSVVMLLRKLTIKRDTDYQDNGDLLADTINADFDRLWLAMQQAFLSDSLSLKRPLLGGDYNAGGLKVIGLKDPTNPQDAATKAWVDLQYSVPTSEAKQAAVEAKEARDESREIADKFGDVDGAVTAANAAKIAAEGYADDAKTSADNASNAAGHAEAIVDVYGTYPTIPAGIAATASGQYFRVPQGVGSRVSFRYYLNESVVATEVTSLSSSVAIDLAIRESNLAVALGVKFTALMTHSGELLNGAVGWDGSEVVTGPRYGGWKTPTGQTGFNAYVFAQLIFNAAELSFLNGKIVSFVVDITHSANLSGKLSNSTLFIPMLRVNGVDITGADISIISVSDTNTIAMFERKITAADNSIMLALRYRNNTPLTEDVWFYNRTAYYRLQDPNGFQSEQAYYDKRQFIPPVNNLAYLSPKSAEAMGGATLDYATSTITIPAGETGFNSYSGAFLRVHNNRVRAGETIRLATKFTCSSGFLRTLTATQIGMLAQRDGVQSSGVQVAGTESLIFIDENNFMIMADYVIAGNASELVSLYFQVKDDTFTGSQRTFKLVSTSFFFISDGETEGDKSRAIKNGVTTSGSLMGRFSSVSGEGLNGAVLDVANRAINTPAGFSSYNAYLLFFLSYPGLVKFVGSTVRFTMLFETSDDVTTETTPTVNLRVITPSGTTNYAAAFNTVTKLTSKLMRGEVTYVITGNETTFAPFIQLKSTTVRTSAGYFKLVDMRADLLDVVTLGDTLGDQMASLRESVLKSDIISALSGSASYSAIYTIKPDGTGDYTSLKTAMAAHGGGASNNARILYAVYENISYDVNIVIPKYVDIIGIGWKGAIWFKGELPDTVDPAQIPLTQTFWMNDTSRIRNIKITAKNMRYPVHSDSLAYPDTSIKNAVLDIEECDIEHYGNAGAQAYQDSIGSGVTVWSAYHAWGCGLHSGEQINAVNTNFVSQTSPFYFHTNKDFDLPCKIKVTGGKFENKNGGSALAVQNMGSGQVNTCVIDGVTLQGITSIDSNTQKAEKLVNDWGDRNSEFQIHIRNCTPIAVKSTNDSRVLQLISTDSATSSVAVSGTAVPALFGYNPIIIAGGSGYPARVYSSHSVKGTLAGSLIGQRLGDCTAVNKLLTVVFDGGSPVTLTLAANYTAMTNDAVVAALNTLLNDSSGRSFSVITPYNNAAPVFQEDRELLLTNTSNVVILKGTAVAFNGSKINGRRATNSDSRATIAGVALENIVPGVQGRVQFSGYLHTTYIAFTGAPPATFLATCSVNTDATLSAGSTIPVLQRVATDVYEII
ncbi:TPA: hypothetical protein ACWCLD_001640 [Klebsiella pneumoniae]|nr:hypothetical protein [Klebsiella pneumoniae]HBR7629207.1 hypothetical protein [Klebsiella pneumoniae]HBR7633372.1 hypothetical protein [Klebsiella pneumoniae]